MSKKLLAKFYRVNKERLQCKTRETCQSYPKEEKELKKQYGRERYKSPLEDEKQKLFEY